MRNSLSTAPSHSHEIPKSAKPEYCDVRGMLGHVSESALRLCNNVDWP